MAARTNSRTFPLTDANTATGIAPASIGSLLPFTPEVWSGKMIVNFYDASVLSVITNTDYEGEIANFGDTVHIRNTPQIGTLKDYKRNMKLVFEYPTTHETTLVIDKGKYFNVALDDVDRIQADAELLDDWTMDASEQYRNEVDSDVLRTMHMGAGQAKWDANGKPVPFGASGTAYNIGQTAGRLSKSINLGLQATPVRLTKNNVLDYIINMGTVLDEANCPEMDRFLIIPAWMKGMILKSDLKDASIAGDGTSIMRNGRVGMIDRFTVYMSHRLLSDTKASGTTDADTTFSQGDTAFGIVAGHKMATTFATQLTKTEMIRSPDSFEDFMRGLWVYGRKVVKAEALTAGWVYAETADIQGSV